MLKKIENKPLMGSCSQLIQHKLIRFLLVAGLNTLFGYGIFALLVFLNVHYAIATFIATIAGLLFNFKTYGILVFKNKSNRLIFRFLLVYGFLYLCNIGFIFILKKVGIKPYISGALWLIPNGLLGFYLNNKFVFRN